MYYNKHQPSYQNQQDIDGTTNMIGNRKNRENNNETRIGKEDLNFLPTRSSIASQINSTRGGAIGGDFVTFHPWSSGYDQPRAIVNERLVNERVQQMKKVFQHK